MSIVLIGVDMPERCNDCPCETCWDLYTEPSFCAADKNEPEISYDTVRLPSCPAVQLPKKHGRLIDADELLKAAKERMPCTDVDYYFRIVSEMPTILEAEDGE